MFSTCQQRGTRLLYASSAATYGGSDTFRETPDFEKPLNVYGYSKLLFDNVVRRMLPTATSQVAGFRYFNVYGPREQHKGRMASVAFHQFNQFRAEGKVKLFGDYGGYAAGEQYLPDGLAGQRFYEPVPRGLEIRIADKLRELKSLNHQKN